MRQFFIVILLAGVGAAMCSSQESHFSEDYKAQRQRWEDYKSCSPPSVECERKFLR